MSTLSRFSIFFITVLLSHVLAAAQVHVNAKIAGQYEVEAGLRAGAEIELPIRDKISFAPGVYWSQRKLSETVTYNQHTMDYRDHADFITVPLLLGIRLGDWGAKVEPRLFVGPYLAYGIGGRSHWTRDKDGTVTTGSVSAFDPDSGGWDKRFDTGLHIGLDTYITRHLVVGAYTEFGFIRTHHLHDVVGEVVSQAFFGGLPSHNYSVGICLGYRF